jgi:cobalt-zinc-cadmium efflux system membrane fusion protein
MMISNHKRVMIAALVPLVLLACGKNGGETHQETDTYDHDKHEGHEGHDHDEHENALKQEEHEGHEGHNNGEAVSDLDRPISELFAETCEHNTKTYECGECRYEVGVVSAPANLFSRGLLKTVKAQKKPISVPLTLNGEVQFDERRVTHVSTQAQGIIRKVHVTLGDKVKTGQALVVFESVEVGDAEAAYLEARGMLELAKQNYDRIAVLRKEAISSEKELLSAKQELDVSKIRTNATLGKLMRLGMNAPTARALTQAKSKGRLILRAPSSGTVLDMHAVVGEIARSETALITIGENSSLWVWADLYERDVAVVMEEQAKEPLRAQIEVKAFPGEQFPGTVDFVSPSMSELSRTVKLRIAVPNPRGKLLAGMFAGVKIFLPGDELVLTVPTSAVLEDNGRNFVFVHHEGDKYVRRPVVMGRNLVGLVEITDGLDGTEVLVDDGCFLMKSDVLRSKMGAGCAH